MSKHVAESINLTTDCRKFWPRRPSSSVYKAGKTRKLVDQSPLCTRHRLGLLVLQMQPCQSSRRVQASISIWMSHSLHVQLPDSLHLCVSTVLPWFCVYVYIRILSFQPCTWQLWSHVTSWLSNHLTEHVFDSFLTVCTQPFKLGGFLSWRAQDRKCCDFIWSDTPWNQL